MDGYRVAPIAEAARYGDLFITATGDKHVIRGEHMSVMKDGAIICNTGHFNVEIDIPALEGMASRVALCAISWKNSCWLMAVSSSCWPKAGWSTCRRLKNTPAQVMDYELANQALAAEFIVKNHENLENKAYPVPRDIDEHIAALKLETMGIKKNRYTDSGTGEVPRLLERRNVREACRE